MWIQQQMEVIRNIALGDHSSLSSRVKWIWRNKRFSDPIAGGLYEGITIVQSDNKYAAHLKKLGGLK